MRRVSIRLGAMLMLLAILLITPTAVAGDQPPGSEPPDVRIAPPGGVAATSEPPSILDLFWIWVQVRIGPPTG